MGMGRYVGLKQKYNPKYNPDVITCRVLEHIPEPNGRGGRGRDSQILQRERKLIFILKATVSRSQ